MSLLLLLGGGPTVPATGLAYTLNVDWDGDGAFGDPGEDVTADLRAVECARGRDDATAAPGRGSASAGSLRATLLNRSGDYSPLNPSSPIAGDLLPGRLVQLATEPVRVAWYGPIEAVPLWTGYLDDLAADPFAPAGVPTVTLTALGPFARLAEAEISPEPQEDLYTGQLVEVVLDAADWSATAREIDAGAFAVPWWFIPGKSKALAALRELEDSEAGFLYERADGAVVFEGATHRGEADHLAAQTTLSDAPGATEVGASSIKLDYAATGVINAATVTATPAEAGAVAVLWTATDAQRSAMTLAPGETKTIIAEYTDDPDGYVAAWTTPVAGTDYTGAFGSFGSWDITDIEVETAFDPADPVQFKTSRTMAIRLTNTTGYSFTFSTLQARGAPLTTGTPITATAYDAASRAVYGPRPPVALGATWLPDADHAQVRADWIVARWGSPTAVVTAEIPANQSAEAMLQAITREISDRVDVELAGETEQGLAAAGWHIERIAHRIEPGGPRHVTTWTLGPAAGVAGTPSYWILGESVLGTDTRPWP